MATGTGTLALTNPRPRLNLRGRSIPLWMAYAALASAGLAALFIVYLFDPRNPGLYPVCPFFGLTGYHCPGCGTLRALHQLLHGNPAGAFGYNAYSMIALPALTYSFAASWLRSIGWPAPRRVFVPEIWIWVLLAAVISFWLLRNLPIGPFSVLAP